VPDATNHLPAKTPGEAYRQCDPSVALSDPDDPRYIDLRAERGLDVWYEVLQQVEHCAPMACPARVAVYGQRGCGKSTELLILKHEAKRRGFHVVYVDVLDHLNPHEFEFGDLFLAIASQIVQSLTSDGIEVNQEHLAQVEGWFQSVTEVTIDSAQKTATVETGASAKMSVPFVGSIFASLKAYIRSGHEKRKEVRRKIQDHPTALLENVNLVVKDAASAVTERCPRGLLLILDNLERYHPDIVLREVLEKFELFNDLSLPWICTIPLTLVYEQRGRSVSSTFTQPVACPCVAVTKPGGTRRKDTAGLVAFEQILARRIDLEAVFTQESVWRDLIRRSGGSLYQLMNLVQRSCLAAKGPIDPKTLDVASTRLRSDLVRLIPSAYYADLARIRVTNQIGELANRGEILLYLYAIEYDGEVWADVNPIIEGIPTFQKALRELRKKGKRRK